MQERSRTSGRGNDISGSFEKMKVKCEIYRDSMQNYKKYGIPRAQLVIADVPYNLGNNMYGSNPMWYVGGDNKTARANLLESSLIRITILICMNTSIFAARC